MRSAYDSTMCVGRPRALRKEKHAEDGAARALGPNPRGAERACEMNAAAALFEMTRLCSLEGLGEESIQAIAKLFTLDEVPRGEAIFQQDAASNQMYVLIDGSVRVLLDETEVVRVVVQAEQADGLPVFGEAAVLDSTPRRLVSS